MDVVVGKMTSWIALAQGCAVFFSQWTSGTFISQDTAVSMSQVPLSLWPSRQSQKFLMMHGISSLLKKSFGCGSVVHMHITLIYIPTGTQIYNHNCQLIYCHLIGINQILMSSLTCQQFRRI